MEKSNYVDTPRVTLEQAKAIVETKTAPRITEQFLKDQVAEATYLRHKHMTICVMELANGFFVTGKAAPADPANYDTLRLLAPLRAGIPSRAGLTVSACPVS